MAEGINDLDEKLRKLKEKKEAGAADSTVADEFINDGEKSFSQIVEELKARKMEMVKNSKNDDYVKDTIYIRKDIYEAFNALCLKQGDKKKFTNEALMDFVVKKHNQIL